MRLGARLGFSGLEELEARVREVNFPVELALPHLISDFSDVAERMPEVRDIVTAARLEVLSVHASQGNLAADDYRLWAAPAVRLADELGATSVTFHPSIARKDRMAGQYAAMSHLKELQSETRAIVALETFPGKRRLFRPDEIVGAGLPMVLDISHLRDDDYILLLIKRYHKNIPTVHLSARGLREHHLPIDTFCLKVVKLLARLSWRGNIILEYLPWHHYRVRDDLELLSRFLAGERRIAIPPPDDRRRHEPSRWSFK